MTKEEIEKLNKNTKRLMKFLEIIKNNERNKT